MKTRDDRFTLDEYLVELDDHPNWGYQLFRRPDLLYRRLKRAGIQSDENFRYRRMHLDDITRLNTVTMKRQFGHGH